MQTEKNDSEKQHYDWMSQYPADQIAYIITCDMLDHQQRYGKEQKEKEEVSCQKYIIKTVERSAISREEVSFIKDTVLNQI